MFAGLSLFKKLENVVMSNNDSRVIYTAPRDCFVSIMIKQVDIVSNNPIRYSTGLLYTKAIRFRHVLFPGSIGLDGLLPDIVQSPGFAFLGSGENLYWQRSAFVRLTVDVYILTTAEP
jgi:hypothetical protein